MTNEHMGTCIYDKGRFELRETDNAIIDLKGDFPPIMIASNTVDNGFEPNCADTRGVLHLLNELVDNNPNEERHWYLKKMLDKAWTQYHELKEENKQLKQENKKIRKSREHWAFIADCSIEVMNEDEKFKNDYLKIATNDLKKLTNENEQLKRVLGAILLEVKRDITNTNQTGEIKVFINPNSFELISEVLRKYGALKDWYE